MQVCYWARYGMKGGERERLMDDPTSIQRYLIATFKAVKSTSVSSDMLRTRVLRLLLDNSNYLLTTVKGRLRRSAAPVGRACECQAAFGQNIATIQGLHGDMNPDTACGYRCVGLYMQFVGQSVATRVEHACYVRED